MEKLLERIVMSREEIAALPREHARPTAETATWQDPVAKLTVKVPTKRRFGCRFRP